MLRKLILSFILYYLFAFNVFSQYAFEDWGVGFNAGLYGFGVQGATSLSPNFKLRAGVDFFSYTDSDVRDFDVAVNYRGYEANARAELIESKITFPNMKVMVDYYPMPDNIFSITGGLYFGYNKATSKGRVIGYQELSEFLGEKPSLTYEDIIITPYDDGSFEGELAMGNGIKPYLGVGVGRTIPRNRVGVRLELGVVFQGKYKISSPNITETGRDWFDLLTDELDISFSENMLKLWPMFNLSVTYRIN